MSRALLSIGARLYRVALAVLPPWLSTIVADDMAAVFRQRQREALEESRGRWLLVVVGELAGAAALGARARWRGRQVLELRRRVPAEQPLNRHSRVSQSSRGSLMDTLLQDLRYAARGLRRAPGFAAVAVATLALGIGVNVAIFSVVNVALLRPLPVEEPAELVDVYGVRVGSDDHNASSYPDYLDLRAQSETLSGLIAYVNFFANLALDGRSELVIGELVSDNYFDMLGVDPVLGRRFTADEFEVEGARPVAIISDYMWRTRFGADPQILGNALRLNGIPYTVVGVAGPEFGGMFPAVTAQLWVPVAMAAEVEPIGNNRTAPSATGDTMLERRGRRFLWMRGRLAPGADVDTARAELSGIMTRLAEQYPMSNEFETVSVLATDDVRFNPDIDGLVAPAGALILAVVGLVMLVACANIANMLLARASARRKEVAIRLAIGAARGRLVRQLLTESLVLATIGGGLGLLLATSLTRLITGFDTGIPVDVAANFGVDGRVLLFTGLLSALTAVLFGLVPALRSSRADLVPALKDGGHRDRSHGRRLELRDALVVVQVAVSILLLIGGALLARSLFNARRVDVSFDVDRVGFMGMSLDMIGYERATAKTFFDTALLRLESSPGVAAASVVSRVPQSVNNNGFSVFLDGHQSSAADRGYAIDGASVDEAYFRTLELEIVEGRAIEAGDVAGDRRVAVITRAMAERYWPGERAVGRQFRTSFDGDPYQIVGVVEDYKVDTPGEDATPYLHLPARSDGSVYGNILVRTEGPVATQMPRLEQVLRDLDAELIFLQTGPLRDLVDVRLLPLRLGAWLIGAFAALAIVLAAVGLYGVIGYSVSRRTREIGIRMALGARSGRVLGLVVGQGMALVGIGMLIGIVAGLFAGRVLASVLYGMSPFDPLAIGGAALMLAAIALLANWLPARRAARIDPMIALRSE